MIQICSVSGKRDQRTRRGRIFGLEVRPGGIGMGIGLEERTEGDPIDRDLSR